MVGSLKLQLNAGTGLFNVFIVFGSSFWKEGQEVKVGLSPKLWKCDLVELDFVWFLHEEKCFLWNQKFSPLSKSFASEVNKAL